MNDRTVIVGGGIIGLCCAWYLARAGRRILVIDSGRIGGGCSHANCGLICPSHVLPLAEPGALRVGAKAILQPRGPLRIALRPDWRRWQWLWMFARRCTSENVLSAGQAIQPLLTSSMQEYQRWVSEERIECQWQQRGLLFVYKDQGEWEAYEETNALLTEHFAEPAERLNARQVRELEPAVCGNVVGGWYYEHDAHLRPDLLLRQLRQRLVLEYQVECREGTTVEQLQGKAGRVESVVVTSGDRIPVAELIVAAGARSVEWERKLGVKLPLQPGKGYSLTTSLPSSPPSIPMILPERRVAITPFEDAFRIGSVMELVGFDQSIPEWRMEFLRQVNNEFLRCGTPEEEIERWCGWRPMTPDSVPIVDRSPIWRNAWIVTGHNMLGLSMGPATGKLVAELLTGAAPHIDPRAYRLERFSH